MQVQRETQGPAAGTYTFRHNGADSRPTSKTCIYMVQTAMLLHAHFWEDQNDTVAIMVQTNEPVHVLGCLLLVAQRRVPTTVLL